VNARGSHDRVESWVRHHERFERADHWGLAPQTSGLGPRSVWSDEPLADRENFTRLEAQTSQFLGTQSRSEGNSCWRRHSERLVEGIVHAPVRDHMSGIASGDERP
jgi:hypothetical protein